MGHAEYARQLLVSGNAVGQIHVLTAEGALDSNTYGPLRDAIIKTALNYARAVIVDVTSLDVTAPSAWAVFTSAQWQLGRWPDVPVILVCGHPRGRTEIARNAVAPRVDVYSSVAAAVAASQMHPTPTVSRRARAELPRATASLSLSRKLMADWLTMWSQPELIAAAKVVGTVLIENVLAHTESAPTFRLESKERAATIAVEDGSAAPAIRKESSLPRGKDVSGLAMVTALSRAWGSLPTVSGKAVWATIGPENHLAST